MTDPGTWYVFDVDLVRGMAEVQPISDLELGFAELTDGTAGPSDVRRYRHIAGATFPDALFSRDLTILVSQRAVEALERARLTGWRTYPAVVVRRNEVISTYAGLVVTGRLAIDFELGTPVPRMDGQITERRGIVIPPDSGSVPDFAVAVGTRFILVRGAVREAIIASQLSNFQLTPVDEYVARV